MIGCKSYCENGKKNDFGETTESNETKDDGV